MLAIANGDAVAGDEGEDPVRGGTEAWQVQVRGHPTRARTSRFRDPGPMRVKFAPDSLVQESGRSYLNIDAIAHPKQ